MGYEKEKRSREHLRNAYLSQKPSFRDYLRIVWRDHLCLVIMALLVGGLFLLPLVHPRRRFFEYWMLQDGSFRGPASISYPYLPLTLSSWTAGAIFIGGPILVILLMQIHLRDLWDAHAAISGVLKTLVAATFVHVVLKNLVGGLRPNFLAICNPDPTGVDFVGHSHVFLPVSSCQGMGKGARMDKLNIVYALQSFPSGHTTAAFAVAMFLTLYLNAKLKAFADYSAYYWKPVAVVIPLVVASAIGATLVLDRHHHPHDIILSAPLGAIIGLVFYRHSFAALFDYRYNHIPLPPARIRQRLVYESILPLFEPSSSYPAPPSAPPSTPCGHGAVSGQWTQMTRLPSIFKPVDRKEDKPYGPELVPANPKQSSSTTDDAECSANDSNSHAKEYDGSTQVDLNNHQTSQEQDCPTHQHEIQTPLHKTNDQQHSHHQDCSLDLVCVPPSPVEQPTSSSEDISENTSGQNKLYQHSNQSVVRIPNLRHYKNGKAPIRNPPSPDAGSPYSPTPSSPTWDAFPYFLSHGSRPGTPPLGLEMTPSRALRQIQRIEDTGISDESGNSEDRGDYDYFIGQATVNTSPDHNEKQVQLYHQTNGTNNQLTRTNASPVIPHWWNLDLNMIRALRDGVISPAGPLSPDSFSQELEREYGRYVSDDEDGEGERVYTGFQRDDQYNHRSLMRDEDHEYEHNSETVGWSDQDGSEFGEPGHEQVQLHFEPRAGPLSTVDEEQDEGMSCVIVGGDKDVIGTENEQELEGGAEQTRELDDISEPECGIDLQPEQEPEPGNRSEHEHDVENELENELGLGLDLGLYSGFDVASTPQLEPETESEPDLEHQSEHESEHSEQESIPSSSASESGSSHAEQLGQDIDTQADTTQLTGQNLAAMVVVGVVALLFL